MGQEKLKAVVRGLAKDIKTEQDLRALPSQLVKLRVESALHREWDNHLGYEKYSVLGHHSGNSRNGSTAKRLKGKQGEVRTETPRGRKGEFEPEWGKKGQTRRTQCDEPIRCRYAKGMSPISANLIFVIYQ